MDPTAFFFSLTTLVISAVVLALQAGSCCPRAQATIRPSRTMSSCGGVKDYKTRMEHDAGGRGWKILIGDDYSQVTCR